MDNLALLREAKAGSREAADRLVAENAGLVWSVARRFFGRGVEPEDLFQLGSLGLVKAIQGFDEQYATCFSTYAVPKITGEIRRFLRDDGAVKVSRGMKEQSLRIRAARSRLEQRLGRDPTVGELAAETGLTPEAVAAAEPATGQAESLWREHDGEQFTPPELLAGESGQEERLLDRLTLDTAMAHLPERERAVLSLRYFHDLTQARTAKVLGVSQVQVSRLERRALERLRGMMTDMEESLPQKT